MFDPKYYRVLLNKIKISSASQKMNIQKNKTQNVGDKEKSQQMLSELNNCVSHLETSLTEMQSEIKEQADGIRIFEQEMRQYKQNADRTFEELRQAIISRRNALIGMLLSMLFCQN